MQELRVYSTKQIAAYFVNRVNKEITSAKLKMVKFGLGVAIGAQSWHYSFKLNKRPTLKDLKTIRTLVYVYFEQDLIIGDTDLTFSVKGNDGSLRV